MATRATIYMTDETEAALVGRITDGNNSALVARIVDRYAAVCEQCRPTNLSENEWRLIADSIRGTISEPAQSVKWSVYDVEDSIRLEQLDAKWEVDWPALRDKLHALDYAGYLAVVDLVERFWSAVSRGKDPSSPLDLI